MEELQDSIGRFFDLPVFILFGLALPWQEWFSLGWSGAAAVAGVLLLRRLPAWFVLKPWLPSLRNKTEVLFNGWFGPIGIAALFYVTRSVHDTNQAIIWTLSSLIIFASVVVHGVTATPLSKWFGSGRLRQTTAKGAGETPQSTIISK